MEMWKFISGGMTVKTIRNDFFVTKRDFFISFKTKKAIISTDER